MKAMSAAKSTTWQRGSHGGKVCGQSRQKLGNEHTGQGGQTKTVETAFKDSTKNVIHGNAMHFSVIRSRIKGDISAKVCVI